MSINLQKGQKISLSKESGSAGLSRVICGLGWDAIPQKTGLFTKKTPDIDCDASAILLKDGHWRSKDDVVYFGNLRHISGAVTHMGDNLTGDGEGDDEQIAIDLNSVPDCYDKIVLVVNIYAARDRAQHFGMIQNAFIRVVDYSNNNEICKFNLTDNYSGMTAMIFGEIYRYNGEWKFNAIGQGTKDGKLQELANRFI